MKNAKAAGKTSVPLPKGNMESSMPYSASKGKLPSGNSNSTASISGKTGAGSTENAVGYKRGGVVSSTGGFRPMTKGKC